MRKLYIFGLIGLAAVIIGLAWAEQITLSTYYPAPYGVYKTMQANTMFLKPINPDEVNDPQDGMFISDSTENNKIKYWDSTANAGTGGWVGLGGGGISVFDAWTNRDSAGNAFLVGPTYQVECDGFITAVAWGSWHGHGSIMGYTDGNNPPTRLCTGNGSGYVDVHWSSITMPVKKDEYWRLAIDHMTNISIYWLPIGSGSCVRL